MKYRIIIPAIAIIAVSGYMLFWVTQLPSEFWSYQFWTTPYQQVYADDIGTPAGQALVILGIVFGLPGLGLLLSGAWLADELKHKRMAG